MMNKSARAMTLVELVIASILIAILLTGIGMAVSMSIKTYDSVKKNVDNVANMKIASEYLAKHIKNSAYAVVSSGTTLSLYNRSNNLLGTYTLANQTLTFTDSAGNSQIIANNVALAFTESATTSGKATEIKIDFTQPYSETLYVSCRLSLATTWAKVFDGGWGDRAWSVIKTSDKGYIIAGNSASFNVIGDEDIYVIKIDSNGNKQWSKTFGNYGGTYHDDYAWSVVETSGGYIIAGQTQIAPSGTNKYDAYLVKIDSDGKMVWEKILGESGTVGNLSDAWSIYKTSDGYCIIAGQLTSSADRTTDAYLIKINPEDGSEVWPEAKRFGSSTRTFDAVRCVIETRDGYYVMAGQTYPSSTTSDVYLIKTDSDGNVEEEWPKTFDRGGLGGYDQAYSVCETFDGYYILAGYASSSPTGSGGRWWGYLIKTDSDGNKVGENTFGQESTRIVSVIESPDRCYIMAGKTYLGSPRNCNAAYLVKADSDGNEVWEKTFDGTTGHAAAFSVCKTSDGGYILVGQLSMPHPIYPSTYGPSGAYIIKTDANGDCPQADNPTVVSDVLTP